MASRPAHPLQVKDVMTPDVVTLSPQQPFAQALTLLARHRFRHLLVTDADTRLVGVISDRDMLRFMSQGRDLEEATVADVMWHPIISVKPETFLSEAASQMLSRRINCLPVVADDQLCGILTSTDLLSVFQHMQKQNEDEIRAEQSEK